ncbi:F0F1 ATP synthase subunit B' [Lichenibacterium ramalinae]|uniref:ATP synthase subunit b n=1 Tax=Lichenibacterium ramalinae TaxID=2316527 RepID=A0A4Q2REW9_9HYPH|nr:F0F1 ATP synthase subunit B' [Lichenibacterium ramalinae]RYB04769.1 F0F1 ATP synthase subunit B' [Lichenibacterium ramalinae]
MAVAEQTLANASDLDTGSAAFPPFESSTYLSQIVWLVIVFGLLYWLMSRIALPRVGAILENRRSRIEGDLADAARMQEQATAASAAYDSKLAEAKTRAQALAQKTHEELLAADEARRHTLEGELNGKMAAAERQIAETKTRAMGNVEGIARDAAAAIVQHLTGKAADPQAVDAALSSTAR